MLFIKRMLLAMVVLVFSINAKSNDDTLFLLKPKLDSLTIGIKTSVDDRAELCNKVAQNCMRFFKKTIVIVASEKFAELKSRNADFLIWDLEHYHFFFSDQEHEACIKATLYRFSASNNYAEPIFAATPPMLKGDESYGDFAPLIDGVYSYFKTLRSDFTCASHGNAVIPKISAEELLKNDPLRDAASKVYVLVSPLNDSTVGSDPMSYEVIHLPRMVAHFVGALVNKASVVIDETVVATLKEQSISTTVARVELHNYGDGDNVLGLKIYASPDLEKPIYTTLVKDPRKAGWRMNDDFQKGLEAIFRYITSDFKARSVQKLNK